MTQFAEVETVADFLESEEIKMNVLPAHENPYRVVKQNNLDFHYSCQLINNENQWFVVYFSKGFLIRTWKQPNNELSPVHVPMDKIGTDYDGPMPPFDENTTQAELDTFNYCSKPTPPTMVEVMNCLANDCRTIENTQGEFKTWAKVMEVEEDSDYAKSIWSIVCKQRQQLIALFGEGGYHRLIHETEPSLK
jgi:hypothetical protein